MTIKLESVLLRMGLSGIREIISPILMEIIYEFDAQPNLSNLVDIILEIYSPKELLGDKKKRSHILRYLSEKNVDTLATQLNINNEGDRYGFIKRLNNHRLPKILGFFDIGIDQDEKSSNFTLPAVIGIEPEYPLFPYQEKAINDIRDYFGKCNSGKRLLLHMPTGAGKTRTSMNVICHFFRNVINRDSNEVVVWLADMEELCDQAAEEFEKAWRFLGIDTVKMYRFYGEYDHDLTAVSSGFVVAGLHKLNKRLTNSQTELLAFGKKIKLIVFDEAHKVLAPTYKHIVELFQAISNPDLLGLSATPGRSTFDQEQNIEFACFFNRKKVELEIPKYDNPVTYLQDSGFLSQVNYEKIYHKPENIVLTNSEINALSNKEDIPERIIKVLGNDTKRNIKIINVVLDEIKAEKKIILFACSVQSAEAIFTILSYKGIKVGLVTASTPRDQRKKHIAQYKEDSLDILVNFGVLTTGFDAPKTNVAIIARPTTSLTLYSQMVGRACRGIKSGGNLESTVYTVVDDLPGFKDMAEAFKHWDSAWE